MGAKAVKLRLAAGTTIWCRIVGANAVKVRLAVLGVTRRGVDTVGAKLVSVRLAVAGVAVISVETRRNSGRLTCSAAL